MKSRISTEKIDFDAFLNAYLHWKNDVRSLPTREELKELAHKAIVKDRLVLQSVPAEEPARSGDTLVLRTESVLPRFQREHVTVTIGRGLYNRALEDALVGARAGETRTVTVNGETVTAAVLELRRKAAPEPTDEMAAALGQKDAHGNPITTVAEYEAYIAGEKTTEALAAINYHVTEAMMQAYPLTECAEEELDRLGALERAFFCRLFLEQEGIDLETQTKEQMQERWQVDSLDDFIALRRGWYRFKLQQCLIYLNVLGLPCAGETDPLDHYEVLSELTERMYRLIERKLTEQ